MVFSTIDTFENHIETSTNFQILQSKDKFNSSKLFTAKQVNTNPLKDGFALVKIRSTIPELYLSIMANYQNKLFFEENAFLQNGELLIKIPMKKEFEKRMNIGFESLFENQTFNDQIEVVLKEEPKMEFMVESFRNKIQPGSQKIGLLN